MNIFYSLYTVCFSVGHQMVHEISLDNKRRRLNALLSPLSCVANNNKSIKLIAVYTLLMAIAVGILGFLLKPESWHVILILFLCSLSATSKTFWWSKLAGCRKRTSMSFQLLSAYGPVQQWSVNMDRRSFLKFAVVYRFNPFSVFQLYS